MNKSLFFTDMTLDRKSTNRKSPHWVAYVLKEKNALIIPMWKGNFFFSQAKNGEQVLLQLPSSTLTSYLNNGGNESLYFLGDDKVKKSSIFVLDLTLNFSSIEEAIAFSSQIAHQTCQLIDFRHSLAHISKEQASMLAYGRALTHWHQSALYCGFCSNKTMVLEAGHSRQCSNDKCNKLSFPRTDPVVIMLVEYKEANQPAKCLLAGHNKSPKNLLSTIAGFVDPGESLEQSVIREVYEEVGLEVSSVEYIASQPWAFPNSLMIGFYVQVKSNNIVMDVEELSSARWFTAEEIANFDDWGVEGEGIQIPRSESIARFLIDGWCDKQQ